MSVKACSTRRTAKPPFSTDFRRLWRSPPLLRWLQNDLRNVSKRSFITEFESERWNYLGEMRLV
jgi:hypothetical protein